MFGDSIYRNRLGQPVRHVVSSAKKGGPNDHHLASDSGHGRICRCDHPVGCDVSGIQSSSSGRVVRIAGERTEAGLARSLKTVLGVLLLGLIFVALGVCCVFRLERVVAFASRARPKSALRTVVVVAGVSFISFAVWFAAAALAK
jgi:hypothetical protein